MDYLHARVGHQNVVDSLVFSPDGTRILTGSWDGTAKIWDVASGRLIRTIWWGSEQIRSVAWSPDGQTIAIGGEHPPERRSDDERQWSQGYFSGRNGLRPPVDEPGRGWGRVRLYHAHTGELSREFDKYCAATFSPDGQRLAMATWHSLQVVSLPDGRRLCQASETDFTIRNLYFSRDGQLLAGVGDEGVCVFDANSAAVQYVVVDKHLWPNTQPHSFASRSLSVSDVPTQPNPELDPLYIARVWRDLLSEFQPAATNFGGMEYQHIGFSPAAAMSAVLLARTWLPNRPYGQFTLTLLFEPTGEVSQVIELPLLPWTRLAAFAPDGRTIATTGDGRKIAIWEVSSGKQLAVLGNPPSPVEFVCVAPRRDWFAAAHENGLLSLHDLETSAVLVNSAIAADPVVMQFLMRDDVIAVGSRDGTIALYEIPMLVHRQTLESAVGVLIGGTVSHDETRFVGLLETPNAYHRRRRGTEPRLVEWSLETGHILRTIPLIDQTTVRALAVSPDRQSLAVLTDLGVVIVNENLEMHIAIRTTKKNNDDYSVVFAGDANRLLLASYGYRMRILNLSEKRTEGSFWATRDGPTALEFNSATTLLARSGAYSNLIELFEFPGGRLIREFVHTQNHINALAFSYNGQTLISGGADGTVKTWDVMTGELLSSATRITEDEDARGTWEVLRR